MILIKKVKIGEITRRCRNLLICEFKVVIVVVVVVVIKESKTFFVFVVY